ncbi:MAG: hypothetical protein D6746_09945 [Bacteroidetes bacterium]|nr:MAG: hypothetical protein D6746_09945 [Bacteroidota bacterium]
MSFHASITRCLLVALLLALPAGVAAQAPVLISHQGVLHDAEGTPLAGNVILTFRLFDAPTDGTALWSEDHGVALDDGLFQVLLGSIEPLDGVPFDRPYWLGIAVNNGPELEPRMPLTAVPFSLHAQTVADSSLTPAAFDPEAGSEGQVLAIEAGRVVWKTPEMTASGVPGLTATELSDGNHLLLLNRTNRIGAEWFGIRAPVFDENDWGGMYIETRGDGITDSRPFYGYAHNGTITGWHEINSAAGEWQLVLKGGLQFKVDTETGDATATGRLIAGSNVESDGDVTAAGDVIAEGLLTSNGGGVRFPDGSVQTTAATSSEGTPGLTVVDQGNDTYLHLINRTNRIGAEWFGVRAPIRFENEYGGMYIETNGDGISHSKPFYGYAHNGTVTGWHELDGATQEWRLIIGGGNVRFKVDGTNGDVFADGTFNPGGADLAEAFDVEGHASAYEPGDVLVISTNRDRTVARSSGAYSPLVAGVYATRPGVLLSENGIDGMAADQVPMGVIGVVPTRVTHEGGPIRRGDLLVTSSTPGHAMKADPAKLGFGMVIGKALEDFDGPGPGRIQVLVNIK